MITAAELRSRLEYLGLNPRTFSTLTGRDERDLRRMMAGTLPISHPTLEALIYQESEALAALRHWDRATNEGIPIYIPRQNETQEPGKYPPRWYLALAGRHIDKWGTDAQIEWE